MTRLTEDMVALRTKQSNMNLVKKLNVWGSGITDITVVKKLKAVEVLALSVNSISNLEAMRELPSLETLYLRKNQIKDVNEIQHLQTLPSLKFLWLDDNPFCEALGSDYRSTIIRMLPNLKCLDEKDISKEELNRAFKQCEANASNYVVQEEEESYDDAYETQQQYAMQHQRQSPSPSQQQAHYHRQHHHQQQQHQQQIRQSQECLYTSRPAPQQYVQQTQPQSRGSTSPQELTHPPSPKYDAPPHPQHRMSYPQPNDRSPEHESPQAAYHGRYRERGPIPPSTSTQSMKEYQCDRPSYPLHYAHSQMDLTDWDEHHAGARRSAGNEREMSERHTCRSNGVSRENGNCDGHVRPHCQYHKRLLNRNSNLLSAALCLVKELDLASLEVVEHSVRCRINELSTE